MNNSILKGLKMALFSQGDSFSLNNKQIFLAIFGEP